MNNAQGQELGQLEIASLLIQNGADAHLADKKGNTPMTYAQDQENSELIALLERTKE